MEAREEDHPLLMEAGTLQKSQFLNFDISSSLKHISTKRHIFVIFCASNLFVDPFCSLRLTFSEFFKSNVVSEKGYWKFRVCCEQKVGGRKTEKFQFLFSSWSKTFQV